MRVPLLEFIEKCDKAALIGIRESHNIQWVIYETVGYFLEQLKIKPIIDFVEIEDCGPNWSIICANVKVGDLEVTQMIFDQKPTVICKSFKVVDGVPEELIVTGD